LLDGYTNRWRIRNTITRLKTSISPTLLTANQNTGIKKKENGNLSNCIVDFFNGMGGEDKEIRAVSG
jgi:hypothetical protein